MHRNKLIFEATELTNGSNIYKLWLAVHSETYRKYHNVEHICEVFENIQIITSAETCVALDEIKFAALFHDFFYMPGFNANDVSQSAELARITAKQSGYHYAASDRIKELVMSTMTHNPITIDQKILCDADLAILASQEVDYTDYANKIRQEFHFVPDEIFWRGRKHILKEFLYRKNIFHTDFGKANWEMPARDNISKEIDSLTAEIKKKEQEQ